MGELWGDNSPSPPSERGGGSRVSPLDRLFDGGRFRRDSRRILRRGPGSGEALLRTVTSCPVDEKLGDRFPQLHTSDVIHGIVDARPNSRVAGFRAKGANEIGTSWKQVRDYFGCGRG